MDLDFLCLAWSLTLSLHPAPTSQLYDLHRKEIIYSLTSHTDTISCLRLSPSGSHLLSFSLDSTLKVWDVRPFAIASSDVGDDKEERLQGSYTGAVAGTDSVLIKGGWSRDGKRIVCGSGDRTCVIWDVELSGKILYKLPGHRGTCTAAALHPREPIGESGRTFWGSK